jgi:type VI secretion system protein VasD
MNQNRLFLICAVMVLAACGWFKKEKPPPPPPEPTRVVLEFEAGGDINPNAEGRASPLVLRVYQMKSYSVFKNADFFSLYDKDDQVLGRELVHKQEILLKPNEKRTVFFEAAAETQAVGIAGFFINYEGAQWKSAVSVQPNKTAVIHINVSGAGLLVR